MLSIIQEIWTFTFLVLLFHIPFFLGHSLLYLKILQIYKNNKINELAIRIHSLIIIIEQMACIIFMFTILIMQGTK